MSEFEKQWPITADMAEHQHQFDLGVKQYNQFLELPDDKRVDIAYGLAVQGGPETFFVFRGEATTGKTASLNMIFGESRRVGIQPEDTEATLFGYRGMDGKPIQGKLKASPNDPNAFLNEISQIDNPSALGVFGDGTEIQTVNGTLPLTHASVGATDNLWRPGQARVNKRDSAMDSRFRTSVLMGGASVEKAQKIHTSAAEQQNVGALKGERPDGLIPNLAAKKLLKQLVVRNFPANGEETGAYMTALLDSMLRNPYIQSASMQKEAARVTEGTIAAARALKLVEKTSSAPTFIGRQSLSQVAALTISGVVSLGQEGREDFSEILGEVDEVDAFTAEVIIRRMVAAQAQITSWNMNTTQNLEEDKLRLHIKQRSFASTGDTNRDDIIDDHIVRMLFNTGNVSTGNVGVQNVGKKSFFRRNSR